MLIAIGWLQELHLGDLGYSGAILVTEEAHIEYRLRFYFALHENAGENKKKSPGKSPGREKKQDAKGNVTKVKG